MGAVHQYSCSLFTCINSSPFSHYSGQTHFKAKGSETGLELDYTRQAQKHYLLARWRGWVSVFCCLAYSLFGSIDFCLQYSVLMSHRWTELVAGWFLSVTLSYRYNLLKLMHVFSHSSSSKPTSQSITAHFICKQYFTIVQICGSLQSEQPLEIYQGLPEQFWLICTSSTNASKSIPSTT